MPTAPIAANDAFTVAAGGSLTGTLGADNGAGADRDPDGALLGWTGTGFQPVGDGQSYLGAWFSGSQLGFLYIQQSGYVTFPVWSTTTVLATEAGGRVVIDTLGAFTYTPPAGFTGTDSFDYGLVDGDLILDTATVTIEVLGVGAVAGTAAADRLTLGATADQVAAAGGNDVIKAGAGNDSVAGGVGNDQLLGQDGADTLRGQDGADRLSGGAGTDRLIGGAGADSLSGNAGADTFVLAAPLDGVDHITDFSTSDRLEIDGDAFGLVAGALPGSGWLVAPGTATSGHGRFVVRPDALLWDADGSAATADLLVATFASTANLTASDILIV